MCPKFGAEISGTPAGALRAIPSPMLWPSESAARTGSPPPSRLHFPFEQRAGHQQRLVVEDDLGLPAVFQRRCEIDRLRTEDRRPDEHRFCRMRQSLAADRNEQHAAAIYPGTLRDPYQCRRDGGEEGSRTALPARFGEPVEQRPGIIDQRILDAVRRDDDGDQIAAIAPLAEQDARPAAADGRLLLALFDDAGAFQIGGDRRDRGRRQPRRIGDFRMREPAMATQRRQHERAVLLPDQFRARFRQHSACRLPHSVCRYGSALSSTRAD